MSTSKSRCRMKCSRRSSEVVGAPVTGTRLFLASDRIVHGTGSTRVNVCLDRKQFPRWAYHHQLGVAAGGGGGSDRRNA